MRNDKGKHLSLVDQDPNGTTAVLLAGLGFGCSMKRRSDKGACWWCTSFQYSISTVIFRKRKSAHIEQLGGCSALFGSSSSTFVRGSLSLAVVGYLGRHDGFMMFLFATSVILDEERRVPWSGKLVKPALLLQKRAHTHVVIAVAVVVSGIRDRIELVFRI